MIRIVLAALFAMPGVALADEKHRWTPDPKVKAECGTCHVAYPPRLLPSESWTRIMGGLENHFGTDASLDGETTRELIWYFYRNGAGGAGPTGETPRITTTRWFRKEHRGIAMKNAANCETCHKAAADGDYSERTLRVSR